MTGKSKILILGAGAWQIPFIEKAKLLGYEVFATDWSEDAPGKFIAHHFQKIDLKDKVASLEYARKNIVDAVFTSADIGVPTAAYIAENMELRFHPGQLADMATNKFLMRKSAREIGLSVPAYSLCENLNEAIDSARLIGYPVIIKPVDNASSRGVYFIKDEENLINFFNESLSMSLSKKVLVEEFMQGTEGSVECIIHNGEPVILGVCDKIKSELPYRFDLQLNYPGNYSDEQYLMISNFIYKLVKGYKISHGIIHVEIMVTEKEIRLIEFALRPCGTKVVTHLIPAMTGFDVTAYLIQDSFGFESTVQISKSDCGILKFIMLKKAVLKNISGLEIAKRMNGVIDLEIERKSGDKIDDIKDGRSRPGYILVAGTNLLVCDLNIKKALSKLQISYFGN